MIDILAPLAILGMGVGVVLLVLAARRQSAARRAIFRELATGTGRRYLEPDDGTAERLASGFEGFGHFTSPTVGKIPVDVSVSGQVPEGTVCHMLHGLAEREEYSREWTVCLIEARETLCHARRIRIRRRKRMNPATWQVGGDPSVPFHDDPAFEEGFEVLSPDAEAARICLDAGVRQVLASRMPRMPLPVEVQIRDRRLAVYLAKRNDEARGIEELQALEALARSLVAALLRSGG